MQTESIKMRMSAMLNTPCRLADYVYVLTPSALARYVDSLSNPPPTDVAHIAPIRGSQTRFLFRGHAIHVMNDPSDRVLFTHIRGLDAILTGAERKLAHLER